MARLGRCTMFSLIDGVLRIIGGGGARNTMDRTVLDQLRHVLRSRLDPENAVPSTLSFQITRLPGDGPPRWHLEIALSVTSDPDAPHAESRPVDGTTGTARVELGLIEFIELRRALALAARKSIELPPTAVPYEEQIHYVKRMLDRFEDYCDEERLRSERPLCAPAETIDEPGAIENEGRADIDQIGVELALLEVLAGVQAKGVPEAIVDSAELWNILGLPAFADRGFRKLARARFVRQKRTPFVRIRARELARLALAYPMIAEDRREFAEGLIAAWRAGCEDKEDVYEFVRRRAAFPEVARGVSVQEHFFPKRGLESDTLQQTVGEAFVAPSTLDFDDPALRACTALPWMLGDYATRITAVYYRLLRRTGVIDNSMLPREGKNGRSLRSDGFIGWRECQWKSTMDGRAGSRWLALPDRVRFKLCGAFVALQEKNGRDPLDIDEVEKVLAEPDGKSLLHFVLSVIVDSDSRATALLGEQY